MKEEKTWIVKRDSSYGNNYIYPVCEKAKLFTKLTKQKTLSDDALAIIKSLGYNLTTESEKIWN